MLKPSRRLYAAVQWSSTLNLPKSSFPPRAVEATRPAYLQRCSDSLYSWQASRRAATPAFVLHDGPPYANGSLHIGHALNKVLKDVICRFQISQGKRVHYRPGWDCHGLPIEIKALQQRNTQKRMNSVEIRTAAQALATETVEDQKKEFRQWAVLGDWDHAYRTMDKDFELGQLNVFKTMVEKGLVYRQFKPVHWSPSSATALAEAELEYDENHVSLSAFVKYKMSRTPSCLKDVQFKSVYALIWTTTPWTLPANRAIAFHNDLNYSVVRTKDEGDLLLVASARLNDVLERAGMTMDDVTTIIRDIPGSQLLGETPSYLNPFRESYLENEQPFLHADFVSEDSGTGLVHMAPGHGFDDFDICRQHGIEAFAPIDDGAHFTAEAYPQRPDILQGKKIVPDGVKAVIECLQTNALHGEDLIWATHKITHKYPIDWRTKLPVIIRATAQWFAQVESIKGQALQALDAVDFVPRSAKARLESFVKGRSQWCISRQRAWGVPIPALYDSDGVAVMTRESVEHIITVIKARGIDSWWTDMPDDPGWIAPSLPQKAYQRGQDTMDVWFDSGTTWTQIPERHGDSPADVYIEGTDQHRGWFQSSLLTHVAQQVELTSLSSKRPAAKAPYKTLITHGFILDAAGRKMSKSIGNIITPEQIMSGVLLPPLKKRKGQKGPSGQLDAMGPDALRLWVAGSDYTRDVNVSEIILKAVNASLAKHRVTFKWLLGALADYNPPENPSTPPLPNKLVDRIAQAHLAQTLAIVHAAYSSYDFVKAISTLNHYVNTHLSSFYFEAAKDPLYAGTATERLRVQKTCLDILKSLLQMLGPVLPLLVTEVVDHASDSLKLLLRSESGMGTSAEQEALFSILAGPWQSSPRGEADTLLRDANILFEIQSLVKSLQEAARVDKKMGSGLESSVALRLDVSAFDTLSRALFPSTFSRHDIEDELAEALVVSGVRLEVADFLADSTEEDRKVAWRYRGQLPQSSHSRAVIEVRAAGGDKCPRCWRWVLEKARAETDSICERCTNVMEEKSSSVVVEQ